MRGKRHQILVVDDDPKMCELLSDVLMAEAFSVTTSGDSSAALKILEGKEFDLILTDLKMKGKDGLDLLNEAKKASPETPVVLMTAFGSVESAVKAMKMGAYDYVTKSGDTDELVLTVKRALEARLLRREVSGLRKQLESRYHFHQLIGKSAAMQKIYGLIEVISNTSSNVLITGESGTGKELVAKAIHYNGIRKEGPFIAINCAAIPETLLESELFGYKKGAFTDAKADKKGLIFEANEGTLFMDEITEMPSTLQAKLLRVLEEKRIRPLGDTNSYPIDARIISTTNRDIEWMIQAGQFRQDLYYRLKVIDVVLPSLADRREDIPLLVRHFIEKLSKDLKKKVSGISEDAMTLLFNHAWPGNVRELENIIQRAITLSRHEMILPEDLPGSVSGKSGNFIAQAFKGQYTLRQLEKAYIKKVLAETEGNRSRTSEILGIDRKTLYRKLERME